LSVLNLGVIFTNVHLVEKLEDLIKNDSHVCELDIFGENGSLAYRKLRSAIVEGEVNNLEIIKYSKYRTLSFIAMCVVFVMSGSWLALQIIR